MASNNQIMVGCSAGFAVLTSVAYMAFKMGKTTKRKKVLVTPQLSQEAKNESAAVDPVDAS